MAEQCNTYLQVDYDRHHASTAALADRYRIERELGHGGMATVYLAEDLKHDRKVALKVLQARAGRGARRRAVRARRSRPRPRLQHPHILPLFDSGTADGFLYLRHAVHRRRDAARQARPRDPARHRRGGEASPRRGRRARLRPPARRDPPRHQAGEHPAARRPADGGRLRHRAGAERRGRRPDDRDRDVARHAALHESRAGDGGEGDHRRGPTSTRSAACCTRCSPAIRRTSAARRSRSS